MQTEPAEVSPQYVKRERIFVGFFLLSACISLTHFAWSAWLIDTAMSRFRKQVGVPGQIYAPNAYRIGVPTLARFLHWMLPQKLSFIVGPLIEFVCVSTALWLLYLLTVDNLGASGVSRSKRLVVVTMFLACLQFPLAWVVHYQRPETTPTALYIALGLWCLSRAKRSWMWVVLLMVATYCQAFMRSDVAFMFGVALMVLSLTKTLEPWGTRAVNFLRGAAVTAIAGGVQLYLQIVRFPHLQYPPDTPVVMLRHNFEPHVASIFLIAMLPAFGFALLMAKRPVRLGAVEIFTVALCLLYFPVWLIVGSASEVRIFVPFLFALCMVAARVVTTFLLGTPSQNEAFAITTPRGAAGE